jgi:hypothetical protein
MRARTAIAVAISGLLLLGSVVLAQTGADPFAHYIVTPGRASGGGYRLTSPAWQVSGTASGGDYRLLSPAQPMLRGNGCCCTYLPCVLR